MSKYRMAFSQFTGQLKYTGERRSKGHHSWAAVGPRKNPVERGGGGPAAWRSGLGSGRPTGTVHVAPRLG
ncbi:hypothetical protein NL676_001326 [Syzygium grande]|nr:hypothetical protein NL676_001326 [Syzygium grande]